MVRERLGHLSVHGRQGNQLDPRWRISKIKSVWD
jgi:hypothetical protein